jgi:hypothetical protein
VRVAVRLLLVLLLVTLLPPIPAYGADQVLCTIRDPRIEESSGLAASGSSLWTVNDGGSSLRVFELDRTCRVRDVVSAGIDPRDVEDLARSRDGTLWLADTGDNGLDRATVALERIRPDGTASLFRLTYPDGPHDAEALLLAPDGTPYIATKEPLVSNVYAPDGPLSQSAPTPLRRVASVSLLPTGTPGGPAGTAGQVVVTGGAVSADGRLVVLRTYTDAYVWAAPDGDVAAALSSGDRRRIPLPATAQGEAVAVSADGRSLLTTTEGLPGPVHQVPLGPAAAAPATTAAPTPSATAAPSPVAAPEDTGDTGGGGPGDLLRTLLLPILGVVALGALISWALARR